jgi:hypothetical protein
VVEGELTERELSEGGKSTRETRWARVRNATLMGPLVAPLPRLSLPHLRASAAFPWTTHS